MADGIDSDAAPAPPRDDGAQSTPSDADQSPEFQAALQRAVDGRIAELERQWQSRKDREIHRERLRLEQRASAVVDLDPDLVGWIAEADATEIGDWVKQQIDPDAETAADLGAAELADEFVESDPGAPPDQAAARERLADARAHEPTPDLSPGVTVPDDAFQAIEARFARGEIGLADYEAARRRRGLE